MVKIFPLRAAINYGAPADYYHALGGKFCGKFPADLLRVAVAIFKYRYLDKLARL